MKTRHFNKLFPGIPDNNQFFTVRKNIFLKWSPRTNHLAASAG